MKITKNKPMGFGNNINNSREKIKCKSAKDFNPESDSELPTDPSEFAKYLKKLPQVDLMAETIPAETGQLDVFEYITAKDIVLSYAAHNNVGFSDALRGIACLVQAGGTNATKPNLTRTINGVSFDLNDLRKIIKEHNPQGTVRQLAKTYRDAIAVYAAANSWSGPLYKELSTYPGIRIDSLDAVYCVEIHSDNLSPQMPTHIREALQAREKKLRELRSAETSKKQKKGKKGKPKNK